MNETKFREWLEANYRPNTVSTKLSEAGQLAKAYVAKAYGDLDVHYRRSQAPQLIDLFQAGLASAITAHARPLKLAGRTRT